MKEKKNTVLGAFLGTIVEYYDYSLYGFSAGILSEKFFPGQDKLSSLAYIFAIYAIAYLSKPVGSLIFSRLGDLYGRRIVLKMTMLGIALPTLMIGLLPEGGTFAQWSIPILMLCRFMQGFFVGGEYDAAAIYVIEHLGDKHRYTASALTRMTGVMGLLLGIASTNFFNSSLFPAWCWRIPFLLALPLAVLTIYYRRYLEETPAFVNFSRKKIPATGMLPFLSRRWSALIRVALLAGGFGVTYQVSIIFMKQYLPLVFPQVSGVMSSYSLVMVCAFGVTMPIAGMIADRIGQMQVVRVALMCTLLSVGLLSLGIMLQMTNLVLSAALALAVSVAPFNALAHGVIVRVFPVHERYRGASLGHVTGSMLMSGTANYVCFALMNWLNFDLFPLCYVSLFAAIAFVMVSRLAKQASKESLQTDSVDSLQSNPV